MNEDDELCRAPGPAGTTCELPVNHGGDSHAFSVEIPPHVGGLIEQYIEHLDTAREEYERGARKHRRALWWLGAALVVNLVAALLNLFAI